MDNYSSALIKPEFFVALVGGEVKFHAAASSVLGVDRRAADTIHLLTYHQS